MGRFVSADSIVPGAGNPQAWNRYSYTVNNPLKYTDPSGHCFGPVIWICIAAFIIATNTGSTPLPPISERQRDAIATSAGEYDVPEIALAAAVEIQYSSGPILDLPFYALSKLGIETDHSYGIGQIRPSETLDWFGRKYSVDELMDQKTSIDLLAYKMSLAQSHYLNECGARCDKSELYAILGLAQNGFGSDGIDLALKRGLNKVLQEDDTKLQSQNNLEAVRAKTWTGGTGILRANMRQFHQWLIILSRGHGYKLPDDLDLSYLECLGQASCTR